MISQKEAVAAVLQIRQIQDVKHGTEHTHTVPEWILIIDRQLQKAKEEWYAVGPRPADRALERLAHIAACGICALEENVGSE